VVGVVFEGLSFQSRAASLPPSIAQSAIQWAPTRAIERGTLEVWGPPALVLETAPCHTQL